MDTSMILKRQEIGPESSHSRGCMLLGATFAVMLFGGCSTQTPPGQLREAPVVNNIASEASHGTKAEVAGGAVKPVKPVITQAPEPREKMVHFHFDSSLVDPDERGIVKNQVEYLANHPQLSVILEGYADERGPDDYNMKLGLQRALSVAFVLEQNGIQKNRIRLVSYGEERPLATGHTEAAWQANRRVEIHYLPSSEMVSALPGTVVQ